MPHTRLNRFTGIRAAGRGARGFTLVELLMAVAIFMLLVGGIFVLFIGSLRAVRQGYMTNEAHEMARGAISAIERDIVVSFTSRERGDYFDFYGGPLGLCLTGRVRNNADGNSEIARISYVLVPMETVEPGKDHVIKANNPFYNPDNPAADPYRNPNGESTQDLDYLLYAMVRYAEPGEGDLRQLMLNWMEEPLRPGGTVTLGQYIDEEVTRVREGRTLTGRDFDGATFSRSLPGIAPACCPEGEEPDDDLREQCEDEVFTRCEEGIRTSVLCETWLRMLSGGDDILPSAWEDRFLNRGIMPGDPRWRTPKDFVLLDHLAFSTTPVKWMNAYATKAPPSEIVTQPGVLSALDQAYLFDTPGLSDPAIASSPYFRAGAPYAQPLYRTWRAEAICASARTDQGNPWPKYTEMLYLFGYKRVEIGKDANGKQITNVRGFRYWNGPGSLHAITRSLGLGKAYEMESSVCCDEGRDDVGHPLPQVVSLGFDIVFPSPFPGVPSLYKHFARDIDVPSGSQYQGPRP